MHKKEQEQEQDQKQEQQKKQKQAQSQGQEQVFFENREAFRSWLEKHHDSSPGIWMIYYKKHTDKPCIEYREALEEALCFGWIDSTLKKVDEERYLRKFTPPQKRFQMVAGQHQDRTSPDPGGKNDARWTRQMGKP